MRAIRVGLVAALIFSLSLGPAQAGIFDCLKGQTITIPQWTPSQAPVVIQQQAPQNGLIDAVVIKLIESILTGGGGGGGSGGGGGGGGGGDSSSLQRANATLDRIDGKMDRLEVLIVDRLNKVESDVATVAKAQRESTAQLEQRLVETTNLVHENTKLIKTNADAILVNSKAIKRTQDETAALFANAGLPIPSAAAATPELKKIPAAVEVPPAKTNLQEYASALLDFSQSKIPAMKMKTPKEMKIMAKLLSTNAADPATMELSMDMDVELVHKLANGEAIIRWETGEKGLEQRYLGVVKHSDLH